ncbi:histidinol-phosphate transaminase [bacterium]|nr:histidinol-phosphate transaminase [bacterium]
MSPKTEKLPEIIKLSQNENAFGASPMALKAIKANIDSVFRYPDVLHEELKMKLAYKNSVSPGNIVIAAGSIALMDMSIKAFVGFDENVVTPEVTFEGYKYMAKVNKRACKLSKLVNNAISLENVLATCDAKTKVVFIANPNNPTGTMITHDEMYKFMQSASSDTYIVSDEAYTEYVTDDGFPNSLEILNSFPNLIIFRTFSKIYGLAGLRIGYAIAQPDVISALRECWTPFSINNLSYVAAIAALDDAEYVEKCATVNAVERMILYNELMRIGFKVVEPKGNFIFVEFETPQEKNRICDMLIERGIFTRPLDHFGQDSALRISVGRPEENQRVIESLKQIRL